MWRQISQDSFDTNSQTFGSNAFSKSYMYLKILEQARETSPAYILTIDNSLANLTIRWKRA